MKTLNPIVKTIAALCITGALFFSCSMYDPDKDGTLVINLPGSDSARAATAATTGVSSSSVRKYRIACGNGTEEVIRVASSGSVSMSLPSGRWAVILTVLDDSGQDIGSSDMETVVIEGGKTKSLSIEIYLDKNSYLGPGPLVLSGQVYGGKSNNEDLNLKYQNYAYVSQNTDFSSSNMDNVKTEGDIRGGILREYTINISPPNTRIKDEWKKIDNTEIKLISNTGSNITDSATGTFLILRAKSQGKNFYTLSKKRAYTYQSTTIIESVRYLYVSETLTVKTSAYELKLSQGWNAIYTKEENNKTIDIRLRNPVLRWTLYYVGHGDTPPSPWPSRFE